MDYEEALTAKVAWYYYSQEMTQQQISDRLGIGRMRVVKLLDRARRTGVIRYHLREGSAKRTELEQCLMDAYGLSDAFIVTRMPSAASVIIWTGRNLASVWAGFILYSAPGPVPAPSPRVSSGWAVRCLNPLHPS